MDINTPVTHNNQSRQFLPRGEVVVRALRTDPSLEYLVYFPKSGSYESPVLAYIHGLSGNFREQAQAFISYCESYGIILVAPHFSEEQHADYQRLGRLGRGKRADMFLNSCLAEVTSLIGVDTTQINLLGYSGGAQFVHRYLMAHPKRVSRAVVVAAGWYTFPDTQLKFPYGIRSSRKLPGVIFNPEAFLRVPITVLVGDQDVDLNGLRSNSQLDEQQGKNRMQRARKWVAAMRSAADAYGIEPYVSYSTIPGVGHAFSRLCQQGTLAERVFSALFEVPGTQLLKKKGKADTVTGLVNIN